MMERPAGRPFLRWRGFPLPVQAAPGFTQYPARPARAGNLFHGREMRVDDLVQLSPESALFEMSSNSANAFPAISSAVRVFPSSPASLSFLALSFLFSARSRASSAGSAPFAGLPADDDSLPTPCCLRQYSI